MPEFVTNIEPNGRRPTVDRRHEGERVDAVLESSLGLPAGAIARQMNGKRADPTLYKLATQAQAIVNRNSPVPLSASDLMTLGADRLLAIVTNGGTKAGSAADKWAGYSLNSFHAAHSAYNENEDAGEMLRLATTVRTLFGGSSPETIAKLGRERLEALKAELTPEKAAPATNGAQDFHAQHSAYDEWAGYDINNPYGTK